MSETKLEKISERTERYAEVMAEAARRGWARTEDDFDEVPLVTIPDVFEAVCVVHPGAFGQLLGRNVSVPHTERVACRNPPGNTYHSSEVDRYLSPYGGVIQRMLSSFPSVEMPVDSLHIAGALLWEPIPEVMSRSCKTRFEFRSVVRTGA